MGKWHDAGGHCGTCTTARATAGARQVVWVTSRAPCFGFGYGQAAPLTTVRATEWNEAGGNETCREFRGLLWNIIHRFDGFVAVRNLLPGVQDAEIFEQCRHTVEWRVAVLLVGLLG